MTTQQAIKEIQNKFDVNAIFAYRLYSLADKKNLFEDVAQRGGSTSPFQPPLLQPPL